MSASPSVQSAVEVLPPDPAGWSGTWVPDAVRASPVPDASGWLSALVRECLDRPVRAVPEAWGADLMWQWRAGAAARNEPSLLEQLVGVGAAEVGTWWRGEQVPGAAAGGRLLAVCGADRRAIEAVVGPAGFGALVEEARRRRGWSAPQLARRIGRGTVAADVVAWEREWALPTARKVATLAGQLHADPAEVARIWLASRLAGWPGATTAAGRDRGPAVPVPGQGLQLAVGDDVLPVDGDATWADLFAPLLALVGAGAGAQSQWWRITLPATGRLHEWQEGLGDRALVCPAEVDEVWHGGTGTGDGWLGVTERGVRVGPAAGRRVSATLGVGGQAVLTYDDGERRQVVVTA